MIPNFTTRVYYVPVPYLDHFRRTGHEACVIRTEANCPVMMTCDERSNM